MKGDLIIGGEIMTEKLEKISFKEFQKIHPTKDNWAVYWRPGEAYYKFPLKGTEEARRKQIEELFDKNLEVRQDEFLKKFSWIALYIYNSILLWEKEPILPLKQWKKALDNVLGISARKKELDRMMKIITQFELRMRNQKVKRLLKGKVSEFLWLWLFSIWRRELEVRRCKDEKCNRLFLPSRSDRVYCSHQHRVRTNERRSKQRKKLSTGFGI